jgi:hypothetical protein
MISSAKQHGFADRTGPIEIDAVEKQSKNIAAGQGPHRWEMGCGILFQQRLVLYGSRPAPHPKNRYPEKRCPATTASGSRKRALPSVDE